MIICNYSDAGVEVVFHLFYGTFQAFHATGKITPEGRHVLINTAAFTAKHFLSENK
jgi:hypothetical protein